MRRVNVKIGIKERIHEILGTDYPSPSYGTGDFVDITKWSIQSAMMENVRRVVRGVVGDSDEGRVLRGMVLSEKTKSSISVSSGLAFTPSGNIIIFNKDITKSVYGPGTKYIYANHDMAEFRESLLNPEGKKITLINIEGETEIVYDDKAAAAGDAIQSIVDDVISVYTASAPNDYSVLLGTVVLDNDGKISSVTPTTLRGFAPALNVNRMRTDGIESVLDSVFKTQTTIYDALDIKGVATVSGKDSKLTLGADSELSVITGAVEQSGIDITITYVKPNDTSGEMVFKKGILISST
jgi:hypothetical protein